MSCYFRYIKDLLDESGLRVTPENKKAIDQTIHRLVGVKYKHCMPDCWAQVKQRIAVPRRRKALVSALQKASAKPSGRTQKRGR